MPSIYMQDIDTRFSEKWWSYRWTPTASMNYFATTQIRLRAKYALTCQPCFFPTIVQNLVQGNLKHILSWKYYTFEILNEIKMKQYSIVSTWVQSSRSQISHIRSGLSTAHSPAGSPHLWEKASKSNWNLPRSPTRTSKDPISCYKFVRTGLVINCRFSFRSLAFRSSFNACAPPRLTWYFKFHWKTSIMFAKETSMTRRRAGFVHPALPLISITSTTRTPS